LIPQRDERLHGLLDGRRAIRPVRDVEIDVVGAEAPQALLHLVRDRLLAEIPVDRPAVVVEEVAALPGVPDDPALGRQHHLVAPALDRLADDLLGSALAVRRGRVDQGDTLVERGPDRGDRLRLVGAAPHPASDGPGPETDDGCLDRRRAQRAGLHFR
jgi:hypothetical protein